MKRVLGFLAAIAGALLRAVFAVIRIFRHPRPIHTRGLVLTGEMRWSEQATDSAVPWIDDAPAHAISVTARLSRSIGMPSLLPDVTGFALRVPTTRGYADLALASTGSSLPGRFLLLPRSALTRGAFCSLLPYRTPRGPVLICAKSEPGHHFPSDLPSLARALQETPWRLRLHFASLTGRWQPFAELTLATAADQDDRELRFDPVRHPLPGTESYRWARLVRQPSYSLAQRRG